MDETAAPETAAPALETAAHGGPLTRDDVRDVWEADPTWALLRSTNSRWVVPLFSEHLEQAEGPVSADWFHQRVADALEQNGAEQNAAEQQADHARHDGAGQTTAEEAPLTPAPDGPAPETRATPADYCRSWVDARWLIRTRASSADTARAEYRLSPHALRALRIVRELVEADNAVSEARLGSIANAVRQLAGLADPSVESQLGRIDAQLADLQRRRDRIEQHGTEPVPLDALSRQLHEVVRLTASLPADFRQLSAMVEQRHREVARRAASQELGKGALVDQYLRENDLLEQTPEGRAYRGFAQMLSSSEIDQMRADIETVLAQPDAASQIGERQRAQLEQLISSLLAEEQAVQETYGRWTSSLRRFLSRSGADRHQRLLALADRALDAGAAWAEQRPGAAVLPADVLGLGPLDAVDLTQLQLWSERGRPTVDVQVTEGDLALPEADRVALRLTAGTSPAAVAGTLDRLLAERAEVSSTDVWLATEPEFRRLGLVLSMLDLAVDRGLVTDDRESVVLTADEGGTGREVVLPRLVFTAPSSARSPKHLQGDPA
ncbi:DUF3375 family protein [Frigoribacterium sp. ACAM 257]|uniref:DUF3375 family protein n=1 Tax=Frigoribacterium sp. ACAM 257 TaxID=2508998 RepID=UPI00174A1BB7|nr:DUF3375 family protein [Frigoribacterium sp. ACAM 257]